MPLIQQKKTFWLFFITVCAVILISCATKSSIRYKKFSQALEKSLYEKAVNDIKKDTKLYGKTNRFLYYMDIGVLFHYASQYDSSNLYLEEAVSIYDELFARSVSKQAASILTNDNILPYRSKPYEMILVHQFKALNYMAMGKFDGALVETRRAQLLFNEWDRKDKKAVKYTNDGMFHYLSSIAYDSQDETDNASISLFKSIEAFKSGVISLPSEIENYAYYKLIKNDRQSDIDLLKIKSTIPEDQVPLLDNGSEIILVGHAGKGPSLQEWSWWGTYVRDGLLVVHYHIPNGKTQTITLPAPGLPEKEYKKASKGKKTLSGTTLHIKFAMPQVKTRPSNTSYFTVQHSSLTKPKNSIEINNLDKLAQKHLDDTRKSRLIKTVTRVVLRTVASHKTKQALSGSHPLANLLVNVGMDVLSDQLEKADTRSCFLIPKSIHIVRVPVSPGTHSLEVAAKGKSGQTLSTKIFSDIMVKQNEKKVILYSSWES